MAEPVRNTSSAAAPLRPVRLGAARVELDRRSDGSIILRSPLRLEAHPDKITQRLEHWAKAAPDRIFLAQRTADGAWRTLRYAQALAQVRALAQALLERDPSPERPIAILSGNDIEHALLGLAAMFVGLPYAPISVPYSLMSICSRAHPPRRSRRRTPRSAPTPSPKSCSRRARPATRRA